MKALFKDMDLYKGIILGCLVLIPVAAYFVYWVEGEIEIARRAIAAAERRGGDLTQIGQLRNDLETMSRLRDSSIPTSALTQAAIMGVASPRDVPVPPINATMKTKSTRRPSSRYTTSGPNSPVKEVERRR